ncbi:MAG: hypothetical protein R3E09_13145 [Novosphingobium sp.]|nr:hypothetical protein [Novosphingobium sp.]
MEGRVATVEEVKARWAYAEVKSTRVGISYEPCLSPGRIERARQGDPFEDIPRDEWPSLVSALAQARPSRFVEQIHIYGADHYECVHWRPSDLLNCLTLPIFGLVPFYRFLAMPYRMDDEGNPRRDDPRYVAANLPYDDAFTVEGPIIVVRDKGHDMLLEGYLRSILWLRNPGRPLAVWLPSE